MSTFEPVVRIPDPELLLRAPAQPGGYTDDEFGKRTGRWIGKEPC